MYNVLMNKAVFFSHYPIRRSDSNKFDNGRIFLLGGSYGMAGACILNIIGARSVGTSYIDVLLPEEIYPIVAANEITSVYHPDSLNKDEIEIPALLKAQAIGFGSGMTNHPKKKAYLEFILKNTDVPLIVDAEGLNLLSEYPEYFSYNSHMILTPHLGEFSRLVSMPIKEIEKDRIGIAVNYAKEKSVILILKGPKTLVVNKDGSLIINDSGNEALARAGSGDILTGMITGLCSLYEDPFQAAADAVWLHGHLADEAVKEHAKEIFDLCSYPEYADAFFFRR